MERKIGRIKIGVFLFVSFCGFFVTAGIVQAQSSPVFVPDKYVPLSKFVSIETPSWTVTLDVKPEILNYLRDQQIFVAHNTANGVEYLTPSFIDYSAGKVSVNTLETGIFTVVSPTFKNDFPLVTHWNQSLNNGRGGPQIGGVDPLGRLDIDLQGTIIDEKYYYDTNPDSPYAYNTEDYALFSGDSQNPFVKVPGYERYVAEDYEPWKI